MIFFCPKRLRDFFDPGACMIVLSREVAFFPPRGCMIFFPSKRLHDFFLLRGLLFVPWVTCYLTLKISPHFCQKLFDR